MARQTNPLGLAGKEVTFKKCQWPIGEPGKKGFRFCGKPTEPNRPYCPEHCEKAYIKPQPYRRKTQERYGE